MSRRGLGYVINGMKLFKPCFPGKRFGPLKFGSHGLGNLMLIWARAYVSARKHEGQMIWPEWSQIHFGSWLRWERDKRLYGKLFKKPLSYIDISQVTNHKRVSEEDFNREKIDYSADIVIEFHGIEQGFQPLFGKGEILWQELCYIARGDLKAMRESANDVIGFGIRLTDAKSAGWSTPISWFQKRLIELRKLRPRQKIWVFSDGSDEELSTLFIDPLVTRAPSWRDPLNSIAQMSGTRAMIVTGGSSFYRWGALLGGMPVLAHAVDRWHVDIWSSITARGLALTEDQTPTDEEWARILINCN